MKWSYILFLPAAVSFVWALATMLLKKHLTRAQILMSLTLILEGFAMVVLGIFFRGRAGSLFIYDFLFETVVMICPPMYYMSICSLTEPRGVSLRQRRLFFIPLFFIAGLTACAFALGPRRYEIMCYALRDDAAAFIPGDTAWNALLFWDHLLFPALTLLLSAALIIIGTSKVRLFQRRFNSYYARNINAPAFSSTELVVLTWLFVPLAILAVFAIDFRPLYYKYWLIVCSVLLAVVQFLVGRFTYRMNYDARFLADFIRKKTLSVDRQNRESLTDAGSH